MDDLELMSIDADVGFTYDARGRMLRSNEPLATARRPAPRLVVGRTRAGNVVRFNADVPDALADQLEAILSAEPPLLRISKGPLIGASAIRDALAAYAPVEAEESGPSYRFPDDLPPPGTETTLITQANREIARATFPWLYDEALDWQPTFAVVQDGAAVSICFSSRWTERAAAAGVDTLADFRGRGYASAVTAAWSNAVRATGRIPFYGTGCDNLASQGVARRLSLIAFGEHLSWT